MRRRDETYPENGFENWGGYMPAKIAKLEEQFNTRAGKNQKISSIFGGVSIYVNGFTTPSADELKELMSIHGGIYHTYQRSEDFIIASNLPDTKVKNMSLARVVKPEWITDSIAANKLLDYKDYLLYKNSRTQPQLNFHKTVLKACDDSKAENAVSINKQDLNSEDKNIISEMSSQYHSNINFSDVQSTINKKSVNIAKTAADPNFISEFYNNSRLHHISQLGACFKQHINELRDNSKYLFPARENLREMISMMKVQSNPPLKFDNNKIIMHIDMDCFFVSVGLRNRPDLIGKPVAVTHSKGGQVRTKRPGVDRGTEFNLYRQKQAKKFGKTDEMPEDIDFETRVDSITDEDNKYGSMSEIASCSYEARAKGLNNGMFMGAALQLCPDLQTISYDFEGYKEVAFTLYNTIAQYTLDIEAVSCDEMYVDCTDLISDLNVSVQDFATALRNEIKAKTGCPCSTGFGGNRLQARLATKKAKPNGQFFLTEDAVDYFMNQIKLRDLPGVGRQTAHKLESLGHLTCGSLQSLSLPCLQQHLGMKTGAQLYDQCHGRDTNPLSYYTIRKSVSAEVNYGIRFENHNQCNEFLRQLSGEVHNRMQNFKVVGKCITLKLMIRAEEAPVETAKYMGHGFCNVINKSTSLTIATNDIDIITKEVIGLYKKQNIDPKEMRGIGIQITKLEPIDSQLPKGAINKFFSSNKCTKTENSSYQATSSDKDPVLQNKPNEMATSPKKRNLPSPKQKSPILGNFKSPIKRRGRPSKLNKLNQNSSRNLMSKFLQTSPYVEIPFKDPMVKRSNNTGESNIIRKEIKDENTNELMGFSWQKVRELLRAWLDSGQSPLPCDINMIAEYMRQMVVTRNIDKIYILINFLKRKTQEMTDKNWTEVCDHIIEQVQNAMIAVYGKKLYINS